MAEHRFFDKSKRHVRGKKSGNNNKGADVHPALIVGDFGSDYYSMGMTTTPPKNAKQRKKLKEIKGSKSRDGKTIYIHKQISRDPMTVFSPGVYPEIILSDEDHGFVDAQVSKKQRFLDKKSASIETRGAPARSGQSARSSSVEHPHSAKPNGSAGKRYTPTKPWSRKKSKVAKKKAFLEREGSSGATHEETRARHGHPTDPHQRCLGRTRAKPNGSAGKQYASKNAKSTRKARRKNR